MRQTKIISTAGTDYENRAKHWSLKEASKLKDVIHRSTWFSVRVLNIKFLFNSSLGMTLI